MERGELSYSKVRAFTRIADAATEELSEPAQGSWITEARPGDVCPCGRI